MRPYQKVFFLLALVADGWAEHVDNYDAYPTYSFQYGVRDYTTGDIKNHDEVRQGDNTRGVYSLVEPDGSVRTVEYSVDGNYGGFNAVVHREANTHHQSQSATGYAQYAPTYIPQNNVYSSQVVSSPIQVLGVTAGLPPTVLPTSRNVLPSQPLGVAAVLPTQVNSIVSTAIRQTGPLRIAGTSSLARPVVTSQQSSRPSSTGQSYPPVQVYTAPSDSGPEQPASLPDPPPINFQQTAASSTSSGSQSIEQQSPAVADQPQQQVAQSNAQGASALPVQYQSGPASSLLLPSPESNEIEAGPLAGYRQQQSGATGAQQALDTATVRQQQTPQQELSGSMLLLSETQHGYFPQAQLRGGAQAGAANSHQPSAVNAAAVSLTQAPSRQTTGTDSGGQQPPRNDQQASSQPQSGRPAGGSNSQASQSDLGTSAMTYQPVPLGNSVFQSSRIRPGYGQRLRPSAGSQLTPQYSVQDQQEASSLHQGYHRYYPVVVLHRGYHPQDIAFGDNQPRRAPPHLSFHYAQDLHSQGNETPRITRPTPITRSHHQTPH